MRTGKLNCGQAVRDRSRVPQGTPCDSVPSDSYISAFSLRQAYPCHDESAIPWKHAA